MDVLQKFYGTLEIDTREKDIIQIWQKGKEEINVIQIERENISALIYLLEKENTKPTLF